jgi:hypothetical protein
VLSATDCCRCKQFPVCFFAELPYRVVIFPSRKASAATTSANSWVTISGTLGETSQVPIPRGTLEFVFRVSEVLYSVVMQQQNTVLWCHDGVMLQHKNLGILTTLRIGHDNSGPSPKWMVEHVVVRSEVTGHMYKWVDILVLLICVTSTDRIVNVPFYLIWKTVIWKTRLVFLEKLCFWTLSIVRCFYKNTLRKLYLFPSSGAPIILPEDGKRSSFKMFCFRNVRWWTRSKNIIFPSAIHHHQKASVLKEMHYDEVDWS